ncbi:MAG: hypothetical protein AAB415_00595 [Patescibacteria group bacterium]
MASHREILRANRRARQKRLFRRSALLIILALLILAFVLWYLWDSSFFALNHISIINAKMIPAERLTAVVNEVLAPKYFKLFPRPVNWFYPRAAIVANLREQFPELAAVKVSNPSWGTLQIEIAERRAVALWCQEEICYAIDQTGLLYTPAPRFSNDAIFTLTGPALPIQIGSRPLSISQFQQLLELRAAINRQLEINPDFTGQTVITVSLSEPVDYFFEVRDTRLEVKSWRLLVARADASDIIISRLLATFSSGAFLTEYRLLLSQLDSLDLRFRRRIFYKFVP